MANRELIYVQDIDTINFFSNVVRMNRPCFFLKMAKEWPLATREVSLLDIVGGDQNVFVF